MSNQSTLKKANLQFVSDSAPGIRRLRHGRSFRYVDVRGKVVKAPRVLRRIRSLVIPPAWRDVWICTQTNGHIQAVGRDERGRKQYRYHARWDQARDNAKFDRLADFAESLPLIRKTVRRDLRLSGMPRRKIIAAVVKLLETSHIRVGNEEYARQNGSYGLTTLRDGHARVRGSTIQFKFRGKSGQQQAIDVTDHRLAKIVRKCQDLPGQQLFEYVDDDGSIHAITSTDVNDYLNETTRDSFTAKDFRTWAGTLQAALALCQCDFCAQMPAAKKQVAQAVRRVAHELGNTPAVCRKCYIHPSIIEAYLKSKPVLRPGQSRSRGGLSADERAIIRFLRRSA